MIVTFFLKFTISIRDRHCDYSLEVPKSLAMPLLPSLTQWCLVSRMTGCMKFTLHRHIQVTLVRRKQPEHEANHCPSPNAKITDVPAITFILYCLHFNNLCSQLFVASCISVLCGFSSFLLQYMAEPSCAWSVRKLLFFFNSNTGVLLCVTVVHSFYLTNPL